MRNHVNIRQTFIPTELHKSTATVIMAIKVWTIRSEAWDVSFVETGCGYRVVSFHHSSWCHLTYFQWFDGKNL